MAKRDKDTTYKVESFEVKETKFNIDTLIASKRFKDYQQDFVRALLPLPSYTIKEASLILENFFKEKGGK